MKEAAVLFAAPALVTAAILHLWLRRGAAMPLDVANERSLHRGAVPRIGGVAMTFGWVTGLVALFGGTGIAPPTETWVILAAALGLFLISLVDDCRSLPVVPRLLGHLAAAGLAVAALDLPAPAMLPAILALVWMTNLYNFMDGADGLAGGMAAIGFGALAIAAMPTAPGMAAVCLVISGAAVGFLVFNFPPARVFMGDAGSIPLGFLAGALGLAGWREDVWSLWFPLLVFSPFIGDATVTLGRRLRRGARVWQAHREHAYQSLVLSGWSHRKLALAAWTLMTAAAAGALALRGLPDTWLRGVLTAWTLVLLGIFFSVDRRCRAATGGGRSPGQASRGGP